MTVAAIRYGTIEYGGTTYVLTDHADLSNRLFPGCWSDVGDGEMYTAEWVAPAVGPDGQAYLVYWQWDEERGAELEDASNYDWDDRNVDRVVPA